jgi:regulator of replication initiation timing
MPDLQDITQERAAHRFHQMARIERRLVEKLSEIADCKDHLKELQDERDGLILRLREAARNEGDLPLLSLMDGD